MARTLLARLFGEIPESVDGKLSKLTVAQLQSLAETAMDLGSFEDVTAWLESDQGAA